MSSKHSRRGAHLCKRGYREAMASEDEAIKGQAYLCTEEP